MAGTFIYPRGAAGRAVQMQARGLAEAGHHVTVAMARGENAARRSAVDGFTVLTFGSVAEMTGGLAGRFRWFLAQVGLLAYLVGAVLSRRFDCIMFYGVAPIFAVVAVIARLRKRPTCLIQYDLMNTGVFAGFWNYLYRQLIVGSEIILARCASLIIIGYATALADVFRQMAPTTPRVRVWPPTDTLRFGTGNADCARHRYGVENQKLVVYAGAIGRLEGIDILLSAVPEAQRLCPNFKVFLAGPILQNDYVSGRPMDFKQMVHDLEIHEAVQFVGVLPTDQLLDLLAAADCLVMPKIDHPSNTAASPIKVGEYLAAGRPVVASRVCELDTWLKHGEDIWFCAPGDQQSLAEAIAQVLTDVDLAGKLAANGQKKAHQVCDYRAWASRVETALNISQE